MDYEDYNEYLYNLKDQDQKTYYVQYRKRGADNTTGEYITLTKTGKKKYLFWNEWKIVPTNSWVENLSYTIPVDASLSLNDKVIDDSSATTDDGQKTITIPYLFTGKYQLQVTEDGMKPYSEYVDVSYSTYGESINLLPSEKRLLHWANRQVQILNSCWKVLCRENLLKKCRMSSLPLLWITVLLKTIIRMLLTGYRTRI